MVQTFRPVDLGRPSFAPCVEPPVVRNRQPPKEEPSLYAGWTTVHTGADAVNEGLATDLAAKIQQVADPAQLPALPLQGNPADIQRIHDVFLRAAAHKAVVRMALWGDSHTTTELPAQLRRILQNHYGNAGPGLLMPFGAFADSPANNAIQCEQGWRTEIVDARPLTGLGPSGIAASTDKKESVSWLLVEDEARPKAKMWMSLLYQKTANGGGLELAVDQAAPIPLSTKGEPGPAVAQVELPVGTHRLEIRPNGDGTVRVNGVVVERQSVAGGGMVVDGLGAPGRGYSVWKNWDLSSMKQWMAWRPYDLWMIVAGSGDGRNVQLGEEEFRATLKAGLQNFRSVAPEAACLVVGPADRGQPLDSNTVVIWGNHEMMNRVVAEVAPTYGCATFNLQAQMGGLASSFSWVNAGLMLPDYLHMTRGGYRALGERFARLLEP